MKREINKQNQSSNVMLPSEFLDRILPRYPREYKKAYEVAKNVIMFMDLESKKLKEFSIEEYIYWFFLLEMADLTIKEIQDHGFIDYRKKLLYRRDGVKRLE